MRLGLAAVVLLLWARPDVRAWSAHHRRSVVLLGLSMAVMNGAFYEAVSRIPLGATITIVANIPGQTQTMSLAIYSLLQSPTGDAAALRLILLSIALCAVAIIASEWFARRLARKRS